MIFIAGLIYWAKDPFSLLRRIQSRAGDRGGGVAVDLLGNFSYLAVRHLPVPRHLPSFSGSGINKYLANNLFFLGCTATIVTTGSFLHSRLRLREFALRFELNRNKKALEESNQKLIELDQIKSRFFANISHELRTPLTLLLAPLETLIRNSIARWMLIRATLGTMHSNGMRLLKLINDLLDLVRLESG